ncbi:MAG: endo-1,4-beta-xylanase [Treponema sp.]|nr:endo-1,4-beta-xylanase [Treponema sp.]
MKKLFCIALIMLVIPLFFGCNKEPPGGDSGGGNRPQQINTDGKKKIGAEGSGITLDMNVVTLTLGSSLVIGYTIGEDIENAALVWSSGSPAVATVTPGSGDNGGTINTVLTSSTVISRPTDSFVTGAGTNTATITLRTSDNAFSDTIVITTTTAATVNIMSLPPLKDQFYEHFSMIGNIATGADAASNGSAITNSMLNRHFNTLTAENHMKPDALSNGRTGGVISYTWGNADRFVNAATASGFKIIGHTLLWHSQIPQWQRNLAVSNTSSTALPIMKQFITDVVTRYKGKIHTWDVLNEVFPDGVIASNDWRLVMRGSGAGTDNQGSNPWYVAIGADFVFEGFLAARLADPAAILYYNDYNTENVGKATMIRDMVLAVNNQYIALPAEQKPPGETPGRLLIEGIGMQEHHNTGVTAAQIKASIDMFRAMNFTGSSAKIRLSVSELDILGQGWSQFSSLGSGTNKQSQSTVTNNGIRDQAVKYGEFMLLYLQNKNIIERVSIWGITDNNSWRSGGLPLLFDPNGRAKPAYYSFVNALKNL